MNKYEIKLADWQRILFGNAPLEFLLEVALRTIVTYVILLIVMRLLGKRMSGQLTITEMAIMLVLGAIVSVPMQTPERGLLQGLFMLLLMLALQRGFTTWMRRQQRAEAFVQGTVGTLVKDGTLSLKELDAVNISREQLFAVLRGQQIYQLGKVKRLYLEACGDFSTYERNESVPGLSIMPRKDEQMQQVQQRVGGVLVCGHCGQLEHGRHSHHACTNCGQDQWEEAVL